MRRAETHPRAGIKPSLNKASLPCSLLRAFLHGGTKKKSGSEKENKKKRNHMEAISSDFIQKNIKVLVALRLKRSVRWDHNSPTLNSIYPADVHFMQKYQLTALKN